MHFYEHWRRSRFLGTFPYKLSLEVDSNNECLLLFHRDESGAQILITSSYNLMFHRLLRLREADVGTTRGAVITGWCVSMNIFLPRVRTHWHIRSPGKTTYIKFMRAADCNLPGRTPA